MGNGELKDDAESQASSETPVRLVTRCHPNKDFLHILQAECSAGGESESAEGIEFFHLMDRDSRSADPAVNFPFLIIFQEALFNPANIEF